MSDTAMVDPVTWRRIAKTGLTAHDPAKACEGYVLFSPLNATNATILIDTDGNEVHRWNYDTPPGNYAYLLPNGNLFLNAKMDHAFEKTMPPAFPLFKGGAMRELDWEGNVVWEHVDPYHHHDGRRLPHGGALYLSFEFMEPEESAAVQGGGAPTPEMLADVVVEVDAEGKTLWEWRAKDHCDPAIDILPDTTNRWEWTHLNAAFFLDDERVLMSSRQLSELLIVEKSSGKIIERHGPGPFYGQHDPHVLENGNLLLFDNGCYRPAGGSITYSRAIEYDMQARDVVWEYRDSPFFNFYSPMVSGVDPLPNGNVLITEGSSGRIFQVTREGEVVWEFINPHFAANPMGQVWNTLQEAKFYTKDQIPGLA